VIGKNVSVCGNIVSGGADGKKADAMNAWSVVRTNMSVVITTGIINTWLGFESRLAGCTSRAFWNE